MSYVLSVFTGPTTAEGEEFGLSALTGLDLSPELGGWIAAHTGDPDAWVLVTDGDDGDFRNNDSIECLEVRVQDGTVVTAP